MKKFSVLSTLLLTACVTINIYFPAAAADKVADEIIKGIQEEQVEPVQPEASLEHLQWVDSVLDVLFTSAHAADANLDVDTAAIRKLRASMKSHFNKLQPFYAKGIVGVNNQGLVAIIDSKKVPLKDRNSLKKLIAAENRDRGALYTAIANANGHPEWRAEIEDIFVKRWLSNVKPGWWYQNPKGVWKQN